MARVPAETGQEADPLSARMERIDLDPAKLSSQHLDVLNDIRKSCPSCERPEQCAAGLAAAPEKGWDDWDEYCPNAEKLRVLAALTMFPRDGK